MIRTVSGMGWKLKRYLDYQSIMITLFKLHSIYNLHLYNHKFWYICKLKFLLHLTSKNKKPSLGRMVFSFLAVKDVHVYNIQYVSFRNVYNYLEDFLMTRVTVSYWRMYFLLICHHMYVLRRSIRHQN